MDGIVWDVVIWDWKSGQILIVCRSFAQKIDLKIRLET